MTSGTKAFINEVTLPRIWFSDYSGGPPGGSINYSGTSKVGYRSSKTWNGANTATPGPRPKGKKRYYTVVDDRGRLWRKSFYERLPKRSQFRSPTEYDMTAEKLFSNIGSFRTTTNHQVNGSWSVSAYSNCSSAGAGCTLSLPTPPTWDANDDIKLIGRLREEMYGSEFNAGIFLGEGHKTLEMITNSATKLVHGIRLFKKGRPADALKVMAVGLTPPKGVPVRAHAGSSWLELQYGWLPLLSDIREGGQMLAYQLSSPMRRRYRATMTKKVAIPTGSGQYWEYGGSHASVRKQIIAYASEPPSLAEYSGILDPELVAWELIPFSFVADWVAPFGDWMKARSFAGRTTGLFVTTTKTTQVCSGLRGKPYIANSNVYSFSNTSSDEWTKVSMTRRLSNNLQVPLPVVKPLEKVASWQHCANAVALLSQVVKVFK